MPLLLAAKAISHFVQVLRAKRRVILFAHDILFSRFRSILLIQSYNVCSFLIFRSEAQLVSRMSRSATEIRDAIASSVKMGEWHHARMRVYQLS